MTSKIKKEIDHLIYFFEEQILLFKDQSKKTFHKASATHVHDLRVTVRRLRAILWILERKDSNKKLKKLKDLLGQQRDLDVLMAKAKEYEFDVDELKGKRKVAKNEIRQWLSSKKHRQQILVPLYDLAHELQKRDVKNPSLNFEKRFFSLKCGVSSWSHRTIKDSELHEFRLAIKKLRYAKEALGKPTAKLKKIQDQLGEAHDLEVLCKKFSTQVRQKPQILQQKQLLMAKAKDLARKSFPNQKC